MDHKTIKSQWEFFEETVLTLTSDKERRQAEVAFFAGVMALLRLQMELGESYTPEQAAEAFGGWIAEMDIYAKKRITEVEGATKFSTH